MKIRLAISELQKDSIVDGEGVRSVIWTQGCLHNCPGCHNPETHSFKEGFLIEIDEIKEQISNLEGQDGITFSGGDPIEQATVCAELAKYAKELGFNIWCYTGYTFEELIERMEYFPDIKLFLDNIDVLVDGKFLIEDKSYDVSFRGSKNQRLIDVPKSLSSGKTVLLKSSENNSLNNKGRKNNYMYV